MRTMIACGLAALALLFAAPAFADGPGDAGRDVAAAPVRAAPVAEPTAAEGRTGQISLMNGEMLLNVPSGYRFYSAEEALAYLQRNGAGAPAGTVLGAVAPADVNIRAEGAWATIVSYDAIGYVQPETASGLSDPNLEADVRTARSTQNRVFEGFALAPGFTAENVNVVWAERSAIPGAGGKDLRHEQKVLGRYGVAGLTSLGSADQMDAITAAAPDILAMLSFPEGRRHVDFQPADDQVSRYSVPGLVTGVPAPEEVAAQTATGETQTGFGGLAGWFPWVAAGVVILAIGGYMVMRRRGDPNVEPDQA